MSFNVLNLRERIIHHVVLVLWGRLTGAEHDQHLPLVLSTKCGQRGNQVV